jgi:hypothetical protein
MSLFYNLKKELLTETVDIDISGIKVEKLSDLAPEKDWPLLLSHVRERHGGRIETLAAKEFFLTPVQGFFFHYNPTTKIYYEGQASFQFVEGTRFPSHFNIENRKDKFYWNHFNFAVDKKAHSIDIQKAWFDNILKTATLDNLYNTQQALKVAIKEHPELAKYRVIGTKLRTKSAKEFLELDTEQDVGKKDFIKAFWGTTSVHLRKAKESKYTPSKDGEQMWFDHKIAEGEADAAKRTHKHPFTALVTLKLPAKKEFWNGKKFTADITKDYIVSYETIEPDFESSERSEEKYEKSQFVWKEKFISIIIASGAAHKAILASGEEWTSGARNRKTWHPAQKELKPGYTQVGVKNSNPILLIEKDKFDEKELWRVLIDKRVLRYQSWGDLPTEEQQKEWGKLISDSKVFDDSFRRKMIEVAMDPSMRGYHNEQQSQALRNLGYKLKHGD